MIAFPDHLAEASGRATNRSSGRAGEILASYYFERCGMPCSIVDRFGTDIWARGPGGQYFSVEVKSARIQPSPYNSYVFSVRNKTADQFVLICADNSLIRILSRDALMRLCPGGSFRRKGSFFTEELMWEDISRIKAEYS